MAEPKATPENVRAAVESLLLAGRDTSTRNVAEITGGSHTTLGSLIPQALNEILVENLSQFSMGRDLRVAYMSDLGRHLAKAKEQFDLTLNQHLVLLKEARQKIADNEKHIEKHSTEIREKEALAVELTAQVANFKAQYSLYERQIKGLEEERRATAIRIEEMVRDNNVALATMREELKSAQQYKDRLVQMEKDNAELLSSLRNYQSRAEIAEGQLRTLQERIDVLERVKDKADEEIRKWLGEFHQLQKENGELRERAATAETRLEVSRPHESYEKHPKATDRGNFADKRKSESGKRINP